MATLSKIIRFNVILRFNTLKVIYILSLFVCFKSFCQQKNLYYEKGIEFVIDSMIKENPKVKLFLKNNYPELNTLKNPYPDFECIFNFDELKQYGPDNTKISIPNAYRNRVKRKNFINRWIYGYNLVQLSVDVLYEGSTTVLFAANFYNKEGITFMFVEFNCSSLEINSVCNEYFIY
jgi:hypothetical protein